jgi:hypothetical protein
MVKGDLAGAKLCAHRASPLARMVEKGHHWLAAEIETSVENVGN